MKCLERTVEGVLRPIVSINGTQFGFVPYGGTIDAILMVRQLPEKNLIYNSLNATHSSIYVQGRFDVFWPSLSTWANAQVRFRVTPRWVWGH